MKVLSWNIQWGKGGDGRVDLARIVATSRAMDDPDVLCFQEVAANYPVLQAQDQPSELARLLPDFTPVFRPAIDAPAAGRAFGNIVFSRLPVLQVFNHLLPRPPEKGVKSMQRHAVEVIVEASFGPVRLLTTHLEYYSVGHRLAQVAALRSLHADACKGASLGEARGPEEGPYESLARPAEALYCGDFNFEPGWPDYKAMTAPFSADTPALRDAWTLVRSDEPHAPTCGVHDRVQWKDGPNCRDYFFVAENLAPRLKTIEVNTETNASDHQPVLAVLQ
jgi:endonuclease/exonuclease/phosphatase family metal-dependent hydrolase